MDKRPPRPTAEDILKCARDKGAVPFKDDCGDGYLAVPLEDGGHKTLRVRSRACRSWLAFLCYEQKGTASGAALDESVIAIEDTALHDPQASCLPLDVRAAQRDGAIWYDLGGPDWRAVRVTADGWTVEPAPVIFRRYGHMAAHVVPRRGGDLRQVLAFLPLGENQEALVLPWLVAALVPHIPHPALVLHGPAGTGKTTTMRVLRRLLDPSVTEVLTIPHDPAQLVQALAHHYVLPLDNLDRLNAETSDALCRAVTGDGATKRMLYSDDDDVVYRYRRVLMLSGVSCVAQRPDLLDRSLLLTLRPIPTTERREEAEFWSAFEEERPALFGGLLDALAGAMRLRPTVKLTEHPRLADYAAWAWAAAEALGLGGGVALAAYAGNVQRQTDEALEGHPVGQALRALLAGRDGWEGTPAALLDELAVVAATERIDTRSRSWPKAPNALRRRIAEVHHNLLAEGWTVELDEHGGDRGRERRWSIRRTAEEGREIPSAPSASSAPYSATAHGADDTADGTAARRDTVGRSSALEPKRRKDADGADGADDISLPSPTDAEEVVL